VAGADIVKETENIIVDQIVGKDDTTDTSEL
jgi:hypothetical protein